MRVVYDPILSEIRAVTELAITRTFSVASQAAMLALTAELGDYAIRSDFSPASWFVLTAEPASVLANWTAFPATAPGGANGAVQFNSSSAFNGDEVNFFWDALALRLGIGTASPSSPLHVYGTSTLDIRARVENASTGNTARAVFSGGNNIGEMFTLSAPSSNFALSHFASRAVLSAGVLAGGVSLVSEAAAGDMRFYTGGTAATNARIIIDSAGLVSVGSLVPTSKLDVTTTTLGITQTQTSGLALINTTAAAVGAQQISPAFRWRGFGWKTDAPAASQSVDYRSYVLPIQGAASPSARLIYEASINGAAYTEVMTLTSAGVLLLGATATDVAQSRFVFVTPVGSTVLGSFDMRNAAEGSHCVQFRTQQNPAQQYFAIGNDINDGNITAIAETISVRFRTSTGGTAVDVFTIHRANFGTNGYKVSLDAALELSRATHVVSENANANIIIQAVTNTGAPRTITITSAAITAKKVFIIKDESGGAAANNITVATEGAETIDGAADATIAANYGVLRIYSNGANLFSF